MADNSQVSILMQLIAGPGREAAVRELLLRMVEPIRAEAGNLGCSVHQLKNNPAAFYVLHDWKDQAALDAHGASPGTRAVLEHSAWAITEAYATHLVAPPMRSRVRMLSQPDVRPDRRRPVANSTTQLTLLPFFIIRQGEIAAVRQALLAMVQPTRREPGCIDYDLYQSLDDPSVMFCYENWIDSTALERHMNTPNFYRYVRGEVDSRLVVPWTAHIMTMISEPGSLRAAA